MENRHWIPTVLIALGGFGGLAAGVEPQMLARARDLYRQGEFLDAAKMLENAGPLDADGLLLAGQAHYETGDIQAACSLFEKAVAANPSNSRSVHWLGRAYGRRAESGNVLLAPRYAMRARRSFEEAVRLDPNNIEAWNDLFAYYVEAPRFLGGGLDKAAAVADRVRRLDPAEYHFDRARLAERSKQPKLAENHYRRAAELAPQDPGRLIDLADYLESQGRSVDADRVFDRAHEIAPNAPVVLYERARVYVRSGRRLEDARAFLVRYLSVKAGPDDPPRSEALKLLKQLPSTIVSRAR